MSSPGGLEPLCFRHLGHAGLGGIASLQFEETERYLEPLPEIIGAVRRGAAHALVAIEAAGQLAGFYVVHPDRRDRACWWLGWLAIDVRWQGAGIGRRAMDSALERMARIPGCRRVRLLVAPGNQRALTLYRRAGFQVVDTWRATGELVMEAVRFDATPGIGPVEQVLNAYSLVQAMALRLWRRGAPPAARLSGEFHGPPGFSRAFPATR